MVWLSVWNCHLIHVKLLTGEAVSIDTVSVIRPVFGVMPSNTKHSFVFFPYQSKHLLLLQRLCFFWCGTFTQFWALQTILWGNKHWSLRTMTIYCKIRFYNYSYQKNAETAFKPTWLDKSVTMMVFRVFTGIICSSTCFTKKDQMISQQ